LLVRNWMRPTLIAWSGIDEIEFNPLKHRHRLLVQLRYGRPVPLPAVLGRSDEEVAAIHQQLEAWRVAERRTPVGRAAAAVLD
jgi:hypothetical protein